MFVIIVKILRFFIFLSASLSISSSFASGYPKTDEEKFLEENGSILGGEGIVFRWGKEKNEVKASSPKKPFCNKSCSLWKVILDFTSSKPILYSDPNNHTIITEWSSSEMGSKYYEQIKINSEDADNIDVKVFIKNKVSGIVLESKKLSDKYKSEILSEYGIQKNNKGNKKK
jgi:hypothetical protein